METPTPKSAFSFQAPALGRDSGSLPVCHRNLPIIRFSVIERGSPCVSFSHGRKAIAGETHDRFERPASSLTS
jgi:hypothetical protein